MNYSLSGQQQVILSLANSCHMPIASKSVHCIVTSPPYWGLRDYSLPPSPWPAVTYTPMAGLAPVSVPGCDPECEHVWGEDQLVITGRNDGDRSQLSTGSYSGGGEDKFYVGRQIASGGNWCQRCGGWRGCLGLEPTPEMFVAHIVAIFREMWRVLRDDGTLWLNFGDTYVTGTTAGRQASTGLLKHHTAQDMVRVGTPANLKTKDLCGIPWRVAFALQADGWYLRNDIIWQKPSAMPESMTDRCTSSHEHLFLFAKSKRYFYDHEAIKETGVMKAQNRFTNGKGSKSPGYAAHRQPIGMTSCTTRNKRDVWTINQANFKGAHFATYPPALVAPCILAGTSERGICSKCGAPWERVVTRGKSTYQTIIEEHSISHWDMKKEGEKRGVALKCGQEGWGGTRNVNGTTPHFDAASSTTTGWRPTCEHYPRANEWVKTPRRKKGESDESFEHRKTVTSEIRADLVEFWSDEETSMPIVLDPFCGSGTTGQVSKENNRRFIGFDLSYTYLSEIARNRIFKEVHRKKSKKPMNNNTKEQLEIDL